MDINELSKTIVRVATDQSLSADWRETSIKMLVTGHIASALNLLENINRTSVGPSDFQDREKKFMTEYGLHKPKFQSEYYGS